MKNFKRVISAVIALALSASTLVAVSASKFADVDNTNYAEAIEVLTALDIAHGYEEEEGLVFKPEGEITRAEAATLIVGALNMMGDAKAAAGTSKFTDVNEKASWASGYVNVGVAQGFINGMNDTTFAPQENVTYAQMCVMLTKITGYGDYAEAYGGWPTGYTTMAAQAGINKGVAVSADTPLKRGQVAQMLYSAMTTPVLGISEYRLDGNSYKKMDGTGTNGEYKSLLSDKFDGFEIRGTVASFENGKVSFNNGIVTDYDTAANKNKYFTGSGATLNIKSDAIIENDLDLSGYVQQEVKAIISLDANSKLHLLYVEGTEATESIEAEADTLEDVKFDSNKKQIKFGTTKYNFEDTVKIYVNGYEFATVKSSTGAYTAATAAPTPAGTTLDDKIETIINAATGKVKLAKAGNSDNYSAIFVEAYQMGQVTNVSYKNDATTIKFQAPTNNLGGYKKISISDNDLETEATKLSVTLNGEKIELKDLKENDVIAVKTKITNDDTIAAGTNKDIVILVSRETISGKVTSIEKGTGENAFTVGSTTYAAVDKDGVGLKVSETYNTIYLDSFGRIYGYNDETVEDATNYAILAKVTDKTDVILVLPDGTKKSYEVKDTNVWATATALRKFTATEVAGSIYQINGDWDNNSGTANTTEDVVVTGTAINSVVKYTLKNGVINTIDPVAPTTIPLSPYKEAVGKVATVGIGSTTGVIDISNASSYKDYASMNVNDFVDEEQYAGAAYGKIGTTNNYSLVILTQAGFKYGANSRFAVVNASGFSAGIDKDGDPVDQLKVLLNGEKTVLSFAQGKGATVYGAVPTYGEAFYYTVDSDNLVNNVVRITLADITTSGFALPFTTGYDTAKWSDVLTSTKDIKLVAGIVVGTGTNTVRIINTPTTGEQAVDIDDFEGFTLADDCIIYTYDSDSEVADKDKLDEEGSLVASNFKNWRVTDAPVATAAEAFTDTASGPLNNGTYDVGEAYTDTNGNGQWDDAIPAVTTFNGKISQIVWGYTATANDKVGKEKLLARGIAAKLFDTLEGTKAADEAQYALAMIVDGQVVEIYEILQ